MKTVFCILIFIELSNFLGCCETSEKEGFLWKISRNGLSQPSYLLGTAHRFPGEFVYEIPRFTEAFDSIEQLIVEMNVLDSLEMSQFEVLMNSYPKERFLPDSIKYSDLLDKNNLYFLDSVLTKYWDIKADEVRLSPSFLYESIKKQIIIDEKILESAPNDTLLNFLNKLNEGSLSMDLFLMESAKEKGYKIIGLESLEYQFKLKMQPEISPEQAALSLASKLKNHKELITVQGEAVGALYEQDLKKMSDCMDFATRLSALGDSYANDPTDNIKERNRNWIPAIKSALQQKKSMIAVGAGHLMGEDGLINLLRKEGYTIEQFK